MLTVTASDVSRAQQQSSTGVVSNKPKVILKVLTPSGVEVQEAVSITPAGE